MPLLLVFVFGLFVGSFLNVCIWRIPREESIAFPPSHCTGCGRRLKARELVPVLSFLCQRGRCAGCKAPISWRYPAVELLSTLIFVWVFFQFRWPGYLIHAIFFAILLVIFFIDIDHQIIPNRLVLLLLAYTVVIQVIAPMVPWPDALLGALLGGGLFLLLAVVSGGGMGGGDIKLVAVLGLWFGWAQLLLLMFLSFLGGGLVGGILLVLGIKKRKDGVPFGPFLVLAAFVVTMWGQQLINWYLRLSGL